MDSTVKYIYDKLILAFKNQYGVCGLMGNLQAESNFKSKNLEGKYEVTLGFTDDTYTQAVDSETYSHFVRDCAGYGLAQWTWWTRKKSLLDFAKACGKSIGNLDMQIEFLILEIKENYPSVYSTIINAKSVKEASDIVLTKYEQPYDQSDKVKELRASYGIKILEEVTSTPVKTHVKSNEELAKEVWKGLWGNGSERKKRLEEAGYNYSEVQAIVDKMASGNVDQKEQAKAKTSKEIAEEIYHETCSDSRWKSWGNGKTRIDRLTKAGYDPAEVQNEVNKLFFK